MVPNNNKLKLLTGNASVKIYWLKIVEIDNKAKVILIKVGKLSKSLNKSVMQKPIDCNNDAWQRLMIAANTKKGHIVDENQLIFFVFSFDSLVLLAGLRFLYIPIAATIAKNENT